MKTPCRLLLASAMLILMAATGCGPSHPTTHPVSGTVKFTDGKPLSMGTIEFETIDATPAVTATGQIDEQGNYQLGTYELDDGAVPGKHRVSVHWNAQIGSGAERPGRIETSQLDPRFNDFDKSGLTFTVEDQSNTFDVVVEYAPTSK